MTSDPQPKDDIETIAKKCGRIIYVYVAGAICQSEMFNQLDGLVPSGREQELIDHLAQATMSHLIDIYQQSDHLARDGYYSRFRMHLAICDSGIVKPESD